MAKCPKCHRNTYSEKWKTCSACREGLPVLVNVQDFAHPASLGPIARTVAAYEEGALVPGEPCPCCGQRVPKRETSTERVRKWRERKRNG